jgi:hypothetical protein
MANPHPETCLFARHVVEMTKPEITKALDELEECVGKYLLKTIS